MRGKAQKMKASFSSPVAVSVTANGTHEQPNSEHLTSLKACFLCSETRTNDPALVIYIIFTNNEVINFHSPKYHVHIVSSRIYASNVQSSARLHNKRSSHLAVVQFIVRLSSLLHQLQLVMGFWFVLHFRVI